MSIAAVPAYLGQDFTTASPGMRFGMYFRAWDTRFSLPNGEKHTAVKSACTLCNADQKSLAAILDRQAALHAILPEKRRLVLAAKSIAPFATGLGNEHPLENGFAFLWPYGLPYLPGSGVKGVLRQAARELAGGTWGDTQGWTPDAIETLFGHEDSNNARRGALTFWDVIPQIKGDALQVEVMTPHQSHYYRGEASPHDSGQPVPIFFLTVPPGSGFTFHVTANPALLGKVGDAWRERLQAAFAHAFDWLGFGAKTAVGYGALRVDKAAEQERLEREAAARAEAERQAALRRATAGLPEDAARIVAWSHEKQAWVDTNKFLEKVEGLLGETEPLSAEACQRLCEEMERRWKGIMANPDATQGRRNKPKYKPRPIALAKALRDRCP